MLVNTILLFIKKFPRPAQGGFITGIALLFVIVFTTIGISILAYNKSYTVSGLDQDQRLLLFYNAVNIVEANIYVFGQNDSAWSATVNYNKSKPFHTMACINTAFCTVPGAFTPANDPAVPTLGTYDVELRTPDGTANGAAYYSYATQGFRFDGTVCTYNRDRVITDTSVPAIQRNCVFRVRIRWMPACASDCLVGPNKMTFYLEYESPPVNAGGITFKKDAVNKIISPKNSWR